MNILRSIVFSLLCLGMIMPAAVAQTAADEFESANLLYREGKHEEAARAYEAILKQGYVSAPLYFNLGNAYYRLGKTALSVLAYERALRLKPSDPDATHNLALVNLKTVDRIEPLPELFIIEWLRSLSIFLPPHTTIWLFAACWALFFSGLALLSVLNQSVVAKTVRLLVIAAFVVLIPAAILMATQIADAGSRNDAVVTATITTAKTSPDAKSVDAFVIHEGLKVRLSDAVGGWVKIALPDGKVGWIRAEECERI